jgi:hypothetical protein
MNWAFISQKTAFFIVTAVKTSNLTQLMNIFELILLFGNIFRPIFLRRCCVNYDRFLASVSAQSIVQYPATVITILKRQASE